MEDITTLTVADDNHGGARVIIENRKANVASIRSYGIYCGDSEETIIADYARAESLRHPAVWVNLCAAVLCGDPGFYDRENAKWANVPRLCIGDVIEFEGVAYAIKTAPNKNFALVRI